MFFPNFNNNNTFFITKNELESLSFREVLENRGYDIEVFRRGFNNVSINFDLSMIDFLQLLFNFSGVIGMLSTGQEIGHFQVFQFIKTTISSNKNNENIDDNNEIYGVLSNEINIEEKKN
jgi:hypothetical protein